MPSAAELIEQTLRGKGVGLDKLALEKIERTSRQQEERKVKEDRATYLARCGEILRKTGAYQELEAIRSKFKPGGKVRVMNLGEGYDLTWEMGYRSYVVTGGVSAEDSVTGSEEQFAEWVTRRQRFNVRVLAYASGDVPAEPRFPSQDDKWYMDFLAPLKSDPKPDTVTETDNRFHVNEDTIIVAWGRSMVIGSCTLDQAPEQLPQLIADAFVAVINKEREVVGGK